MSFISVTVGPTEDPLNVIGFIKPNGSGFEAFDIDEGLLGGFAVDTDACDAILASCLGVKPRLNGVDPTGAIAAGPDEGAASAGPAVAALEPNLADINAHLHAIFNPDFVKDYPDAWIEIATADPTAGEGNTGLRLGKHFSVFKPDEAAAYAVRMNKMGRNVYVGMALRQGTTGPSGRATKKNVITGSRGWSDFDKEGDDVRVQAALKQKGLEASEVIQTGSIPHIRMQVFFKLEGKVAPEELEAVNAALRDGLGGNGDGVQNCDRVMRLAGTVSYPPPKKVARGYVPELTRLKVDGKAPGWRPAALVRLLKGAPEPGGDPDDENTFWRKVNKMALAKLSLWVPEIFGGGAVLQKGTGAYRISSKALKRDLEEDLSIHPKGITDWGTDDQGEKAGRYTAIDIVVEHGGAPDAKAAALWLCERCGVDPATLGWESTADGESSTAPLFSEEALALLFAEWHADRLRYVAEWNQWFVWDGACWRQDKNRKVFTLARELCRETANKANKPAERKRIASAKTRAAVVSLAGEDPRLVASTEQWDADPWLLNTPDGVVDLRTGACREHRTTDYMTLQTAVGPRGVCPKWRKFMREVSGNNTELQGYLQRVCGYCLTGMTTEQELYFLYGSGNNGKGVWTLTVSGILHDYHRSTSIETFTVARSERHPTELAGLRGARLVTASETEEGRRWAEARIKELTGGDKISARLMRQDFFEFFPQFKLMLSGNHMPTLRTVNKAITRRFNRIPFAVTIPDEMVNKNLSDDLKAEWPGILAWAIEGCLEWQRIGLSPPKAVTDATESYLASEDVLGEWIAECCVRDANAWESSTALFNSWKGWAAGREEWVGSVKTFTAKLEDRGEFVKRRNTKQTARGFAGLRLKTRIPATMAEAEDALVDALVENIYAGGAVVEAEAELARMLAKIDKPPKS